MDYDSICKKAENHVVNLFGTVGDPSLLYHNLEHTQNVVAHAKEIAAHYNLIDADMLVLCIAAWFHDTGYLFADPLNHEAKSVELMKEFMKEQMGDEDIVNGIADCILATKWPTNPQNLLQQILVDADAYHFGTKEFKVNNRKVFDEYNLRTGFISMGDWNARALKMLEGHKFYTTYCREQLNDQKKKNMKKLKKKTEKHHPHEPAIEEERNVEEGLSTLKKPNNLITKGVQTMLRLTSENHMKLSDMADRKANILISVNSIIISVIMGTLMRHLDAEPYLTIPTIIFLLFSVITIVIAILATRPRIIKGTIKPDGEPDLRNTNLLFFGNFYKTPLDEYEKAITKVMSNTDNLYRSLIIDFYQLGTILARKYRLIRWAYNIFMVGIIVSVIAFGIAAHFADNTDATVTSAGPL